MFCLNILPFILYSITSGSLKQLIHSQMFVGAKWVSLCVYHGYRLCASTSFPSVNPHFFLLDFFVCLYRLCAFMHMHIAFFQGRNDFFSWCAAVLFATSSLSPHFLLLSSLLNLYSVNKKSDLQLVFPYILYSHTQTHSRTRTYFMNGCKIPFYPRA